MRISTNPKDKGFRKDFANFKVRLDDAEIADVITADTDTGLVEFYKTVMFAAGYRSRVNDDHGNPIIEKRYGVVTINRVKT